MEINKYLRIEVLQDNQVFAGSFDLDKIIFDLNNHVDFLSSKTDRFDYLLAIASGLTCGLMDVFWVGDFSLNRGRDFASEEVDKLVIKAANMLGYKTDNITNAVKFLEGNFPLASDGNTSDYGGGLQHHLRDFAHHPTIVGLLFSLLTQFTNKAYGTDVNGSFLVVNVVDKSKMFIGDDVPSKIFFGTVKWFFHLVSDMAGSSSTAGKSGGTGLPGPILASAKELATLPFFRSICVDGKSLSLFLSKLYNGTLLAKHDEHGLIIKDTVLRFDLRSELGIGIEISRQALPVIANECIVRGFNLIRMLAVQINENEIRSFSDFFNVDWKMVALSNEATLNRMLVVATGVFTTVDVSEAVMSGKFWVAVNYVGVGRFAVAIGNDVSVNLRSRNIKKIKEVYFGIKKNVYSKGDDSLYERINTDMNIERFGLSIEQTEILYNLEYYKTQNDIEKTNLPVNSEGIKKLKQEWLFEWKEYLSKGFASFIQVESAELHWYSKEELIRKVEENNPNDTWFSLVLLEAMLFEPYFPMTIETDKKGKEFPTKKYKDVQNTIAGYKKSKGDEFLDSFFSDQYYKKGFVKRLRKCYNSVMRELSEVMKTVIKTLTITSAIAIAIIASAGALSPKIAVWLVGSKFAGLNGAALVSACLAFLGGGAVATGGAGMAGGIAVIVGGGAVLGISVGAGVGGAVGIASLTGKKNTIIQSTKLLVAVREIFLNNEHDLSYSKSVYEQYVSNILHIEKELVELRLQSNVAKGKEKKELLDKIKKAQESVEAMKIASKSMMRFIGSFEIGENSSI